VADLHSRAARLASLTNRRAPDDPAIQQARRDLRSAQLSTYIERLLAQTPPLTAEEKLHLTNLLTAPSGGDGP
jgi:hypothetical protein